MNYVADTASQTTNWLPAIAALIAVVLGGGGITALVKSRPEGSKILIDSATDVVVVQKGLITDLRDRLEHAEGALEIALAEIHELRGHVAEMSALRMENDHLKARVTDQEYEIRRLRNRVTELEQHGNSEGEK